MWGPLVIRHLHWPGGSQQRLIQHVPAGAQASAKHEGLTLRRRKPERSMSVFQGLVWEDSGQKFCLGLTPPYLCPRVWWSLYCHSVSQECDILPVCAVTCLQSWPLDMEGASQAGEVPSKQPRVKAVCVSRDSETKVTW